MAMGKSITDEDYTNMLLTSLPTSYDGVVSSISVSVHLGSKALMVEIFEQLILDEAEWWQVKDRYTESRDEAQAADSGKWKGKDKSKDKKKVECYNCCKTRHYKSGCWAKGGGKEGQGPWWGRGIKDDTTPAVEQSEETEAWATIEEIEEPNLTGNPRDIAAAVGCSQHGQSWGMDECRESYMTLEHQGTCPSLARGSQTTKQYCRAQLLLQIKGFSMQLAWGTLGSRSPMTSLPLPLSLKMFYMPWTWVLQ
jgi:hypothetical protein